MPNGSDQPKTKRRRKYIPRRLITGKELLYARELAKGVGPSEAYKAVYRPATGNLDTIARNAHRAASQYNVVREVDRLRRAATSKAILSVNDRYEALAWGIQSVRAKEEPKPSDLTALSSLTRTYNEMAGDNAPVKSEISGPGGKPIEATVVDNSPLVRKMANAARLAAICKRRGISVPGAPAAIEPAKAPTVPVAIPAGVAEDGLREAAGQPKSNGATIEPQPAAPA